MIAALLLAATTVQPAVVATIDPKHRLIEGVATDGTTIWVSSVLDRAILACRTSCRTLTVLPEGLHPLGIVWDARRQRLWVAADCPKLPGVTPCERGAMIGISRTGRRTTRIAPRAGAFHPGDVSVAGREVFVSDSGNGAVYRLLPSGQALSTVLAPGVGKSAQGSAVSPDGAQLIVADYSQGIAAIDRIGGRRTLLPRQDDKPLRGIDGLVRCGVGYVGVYNGRTPGALVTITMRPGGITYGELTEGLQLPDPTQIAFDGKRLLVVPNAGWEAASKPEQTVRAPATIIAIPVDRDCKPI